MSLRQAFTQVSAQPFCLPSLEVPPVSGGWVETEQQAFEFGQVYDSYFATEDGWKRFRVKGRSGVIAYRRLGRHVKVLGGLLASDDDKPILLREFIRLADSFGLITSFYNITDHDLGLFRDYGFQVTKWGEEPIIDLPECTWSGKQFEWVRRQTGYCRRAGITVVEHRREEMDDESWNSLLKELRVRLRRTPGNEAPIAGNPARRRTARGRRLGPPPSVCGLFERRSTANRRFSDCPAHARGAALVV